RVLSGSGLLGGAGPRRRCRSRQNAGHTRTCRAFRANQRFAALRKRPRPRASLARNGKSIANVCIVGPQKMLACLGDKCFSTGETMRRREFVALMGASVAWPFAALAQQPGRTYRLGCLMPLTRDAPVNVAFLDEFRRRGFVDGQNLIVE